MQVELSQTLSNTQNLATALAKLLQFRACSVQFLLLFFFVAEQALRDLSLPARQARLSPPQPTPPNNLPFPKQLRLLDVALSLPSMLCSKCPLPECYFLFQMQRQWLPGPFSSASQRGVLDRC